MQKYIKTPENHNYSYISLYSVLKINKFQAKIMSDNDLPPHFYKYLPIYEEYMTMVEQGEKKNYILAKLEEHYHVSESTIKRVVKVFSRKVKM